jgi:hypothetical protein
MTEETIIHTTEDRYGHCAYFDSYDGSPDANPKDKLIGWGDTKEEAIENLKEKANDV